MQEYRDIEDKKAYLSGFLRAAGSLVFSGGKIGFEFSTENEGAAKCAKRLFFSAFSGPGPACRPALRKGAAPFAAPGFPAR